jgi:hypothetical protein
LSENKSLKVFRISENKARGGIKVRKKWIFGLMICMVLMPFFSLPVRAQTLSEVYVSPVGYVLGYILNFNPGFSSQVFINGAGLFVWVDMQTPYGVIEVYSDGYIRLLEEMPSYSISYENGRIRRISDLRFDYDDNGRIAKIGQVAFAYETGRLRRIGDRPIDYDSGRVSNIGGLHFDYKTGRIRDIGNLSFFYDDDGRIRNIGDVRLKYEYGSVKEVTGNNPGVSVIVTSIVEFRNRIEEKKE